MASDNTVQAFNEMKQIYMESVAPETLVESRQNLLERARRLVNTPQQSQDIGDVASHVRTLRTTGRFANAPVLEPGTENSSDSLFNAFKTAEVLGGVVPRIVSTESYSNWREEFSDILEAIEKDEDEKEIKVNPKIKNTVTISPEISSDNLREAFAEYDAEVISSEELNEDFLYEAAEIATEYFYECGLNEFGIEELIESLGEQKFIDFVFDLADDYQLDENYLIEWRRGPNRTRIGGNQTTKTGKHLSQVKGAAKNTAVRATPEHKERKKAKESEENTPEPTERQKKLSNLLQKQRDRNKKNANQKQLRQNSVNTATTQVAKNPANVASTNTSPQRTKRGILDRIAKTALRFEPAIKKGLDRHRNAVDAINKPLRKIGLAEKHYYPGNTDHQEFITARRAARRKHGRGLTTAATKLIPPHTGESDAITQLKGNIETLRKDPTHHAQPGTVGFSDGTTLTGDAARERSLRDFAASMEKRRAAKQAK